MNTPSWRAGLAALAVVAVLAGCGSVTAAGGGSSGGSPARPATAGSAVPSTAGTKAPGTSALCADIHVIDRLVIVRSRGMRRIQELHFPFPDQVIVTNAASARAVAKAVCALPAMPRGVFHCPAMLLGTSYLLTFTAAGRRLPPVTAEATGCETVTGAGPVRWAAVTPGFWRVLGNAMGLYSAGPPVFSGAGPAASQCQPAASRLRMISGCPAKEQPGSGPEMAN
jgi:hypothetical protein